MATTTNFGWETPDDTDLVKDGALAMRTLGNAIDASLVDLKGGTTGQVLSKNSNTDMDFTWVTSDDANAIQNDIVDAKGDLIAASAADTPARLAVGNNGETLLADSSTSTGLRWQPTIAAGKNFIIGGSFDIWQRGTSFTSVNALGVYGADRWQIYSASSGRTYSRQSASLAGFQFCMRVQRDSGNTNTAALQLIQNLESVNSIPLAGQTVTLSFWARGGANNSDTTLDANLWSGTGTDQSILSGYTGQALVVGAALTLTTSWQRFSITGAVSSSATQLGIVINNSPTGTAGAADFWEITGVQLEIGSVPTAFTRAGGTLAGELAACQRYYYRAGGLQTKQPVAVGWAGTSTAIYAVVTFPVMMRVAPTSLDYANLQADDFISGSINFTGLTLTGTFGGNNMQLVTASGLSGLTAARPYALVSNGTTNGYLGFSAEL